MISEVAVTLGMTNPSSENPAAPYSSSLRIWIEQARAGSHAAFEQIMLAYQRKVVTIAWRLLGNQEDARDAAQEVFLRVYKHLGGFKPDQDFSGWLYRITVNVCHDLARKRGKREQLLSLEAEQERPSFDVRSPDDTEEAAIRAEQRRLVAQAMETLSKKERAALMLRDFEGLPTPEVARLLGSTETTVRSQISTARAKLKQFHDRVLQRRKTL